MTKVRSPIVMDGYVTAGIDGKKGYLIEINTESYLMSSARLHELRDLIDRLLDMSGESSSARFSKPGPSQEKCDECPQKGGCTSWLAMMSGRPKEGAR